MPKITVPDRISKLTLPPLDIIKKLANSLSQRGRIIDLGQGISGFLPPEEVIVRVRKAVLEGQVSRYSDDRGVIELRRALATNLRRENRLDIDPSNLLITPGANQAFMTTISTLLEPGDEVIIPSPYYFNHAMAVSIANGVVVESPCKSDFSLDIDDIKSKITPKTKAIVIVTPNNPTGAVYTEETLQTLADVLAKNPDVALITDETYRHFVFDGAKHFSIGSIEEIRDQVITIGSFSKSFGLPGWRIGYLAADQLLIKHLLKVHDTASICAPVVSQVAALESLTQKSRQYIDRKIKRVSDLRKFALFRLRQISELETVETKGAFYFFPKILTEHKAKNTRNLSMDILKSVYVVTVPGTSFSEKYGSGHMRLTYSTVTREYLDEAFDRLENYFERIS